jgi:hypothetical protein
VRGILNGKCSRMQKNIHIDLLLSVSAKHLMQATGSNTLPDNYLYLLCFTNVIFYNRDIFLLLSRLHFCINISSYIKHALSSTSSVIIFVARLCECNDVYLNCALINLSEPTIAVRLAEEIHTN